MSKKKTKSKSTIRDQQKLIMGAGAGVVMLIFIGLIWFVYERVTSGGLDGEVLLVEAPEGPFKVEPESRGGLEVPHQDVGVFDRVSGEDNRGDSELQAEAETPVPLPEDARDDPEPVRETSDPAPRPPTPDPAPASEAPASEAPASEAPASEAPASEAPASEAPAEAPASEAPVGEAPASEAPAPRLADRVTSNDAFVIQLGAYSTRVSGETAWREILASQGAVLGPLEPVIERLRRASGDLFLIKAVGFPNRQAADDACSRLKANGQSCLVRANAGAVEAAGSDQPADNSPAASPPAAPRGDFLVQLGVFSRRDRAENVWSEAQRAHSELAGEVREISELSSANGTLYRLRFGDFATRAQADAVCNGLKSAGRDCLVSSR